MKGDVSRELDPLAHVTCSHSVNDLRDLIPGSTRANWIRNWIPALTARGVLRKLGRRFLGKPADIVDAVVNGTDGTTDRGTQ